MKDFDDEIDRICNFIKEHLAKTKSNGVVIALSGGLDCSVVAALSAKAIGKENVHCYFLQYNFASLDIAKQHVDLLCKKFRLTYEENRFVTKSSKTSSLNRTIQHVANTVPTVIMNNNNLSMVFSNINAAKIARHLRKKANEHNCLISGTTNRSEWLIGYFTKFDECGCDLQPILHLYKTEIVELAKHLGIPNEIIKRIPSFDLWYRRTNENETGLTYQKLDKILKGLNKISSDPCEYKINGATKKEVSKIIDMIKRTKHKRELPPCLKI